MEEKEKWNSLSTVKEDGTGDSGWRGMAFCEWLALPPGTVVLTAISESIAT